MIQSYSKGHKSFVSIVAILVIFLSLHIYPDNTPDVLKNSGDHTLSDYCSSAWPVITGDRVPVDMGHSSDELIFFR